MNKQDLTRYKTIAASSIPAGFTFEVTLQDVTCPRGVPYGQIVVSHPGDRPTRIPLNPYATDEQLQMLVADVCVDIEVAWNSKLAKLGVSHENLSS
jgi:hypothetical protein